MSLKSLFDFSNSPFSLSRPFTSYAKVQSLWSSIIRNRKIQSRRLNLQEKRYLVLGCGTNIKPGFINLDLYWRPGVDLCWDVKKGLLFLPSKILQGAFAEHFLEHFTREECYEILREIYRVLKKDAIFRVIVPDGELYLNLYCKSRKKEKVKFPYSEYGESKTPMMHVNDAFRAQGHLFTYDMETMSKMLKETGFKDISREAFMQGRDKKLLIDREIRRCESLYVEARR